MKACLATGGNREKRDMEMARTKPMVAIIGRQNVGKSTLLNRIAGKRIAIVEDFPGTTRDRIFVSVSWQGKGFTIVDTGGLEMASAEELAPEVNEQVKMAVNEADVILFLVDIRDGVTASDQEISDLLRPSGKLVLLVANKADNERFELGAADFYSLGLGEPLAVSAYHGRAVPELLDRIVSLLPEAPPAVTGPEMMKLAIVGRPNVGKSMLLNALLGEERAVVSHTPGTTRDAIDTLLDFEGESVLLIDTAGIRRRGRIGRGVERYSVLRALKAIDRADVVLLMMDATELMTAQDAHIVGYIQQATKGVVLLVNKWDLVIGATEAEVKEHIQKRLKFVAYAPLLFISAKLGQGVAGVVAVAHQVYQERLKRFPTAQVNNLVQRVVASHSPPRKGGKPLKLLYATQAGINPPTFVFFVNDAKLVHFSYRRHLENKLRQAFGFTGTPLRMIFKTRGEAC